MSGRIHGRNCHEVSLLILPVLVLKILEGVHNVGSFGICDMEFGNIVLDGIQEQVGGLMAATAVKILLGSGAKNRHVGRCLL